MHAHAVPRHGSRVKWRVLGDEEKRRYTEGVERPRGIREKEWMCVLCRVDSRQFFSTKDEVLQHIHSRQDPSITLQYADSDIM